MTLKRREYDNLPEFSKDVYDCLENIQKKIEEEDTCMHDLKEKIEDVKQQVESLENKVNNDIILPFNDLLTGIKDLNGFIAVVKRIGKFLLWIVGLVGGTVAIIKGLK